MPQFGTFADFSSMGRNLSESAFVAAASSASGKTVFLSYNSRDRDYLPGAILLLEAHGGKVYVDLKDSRLPKTPSPKTANILRDSMQKCRRLVVFVSTNSKDSKWIPWELGFGDGDKKEYSIALLPVATSADEQEWAGQEYFGLYQRIVFGRINGRPKDEWIVHNHHENSAIPLGQWLNPAQAYY